MVEPELWENQDVVRPFAAMWRFHLDNIVRRQRSETDAQSVHSVTSRGSERKKNSRLSNIQSILSRRRGSKGVTYSQKCPISEPDSSSSESTLSQIAQVETTKVELRAIFKRSSSSSSILECPLCLGDKPRENFPEISTCEHRSCRTCLRQYLEIEITESRINIACPECSERYHPSDIAAILDDRYLLSKYEEFTLRRLLVTEPDTRWCPAPDCGYAVIASGCASCPKLKCLRPGCDTYFCYHCKQNWHPNQTCDAARAERHHKMTSFRSSSISFSHEPTHGEIKTCPRCGAFIIKIDDGSCNHMTCAVCGSEFCWLCMKEISDLHYLSPSGCTFWGKKPWSRKKKILWQLGTIVGAPIGIALIATIAVPAIVIGIPVWVGRKIYYRLEDAEKHRRNLAILSGVSASILISPLLAGLAVGIGVPILLAYVYGVVPISLCRSGGCGLKSTHSGVRFEFEEENENGGAPSGQYGGEGHRVANPSIGPSIGEISLPMTNSLSASGSHLDRVGMLRDDSDRESASNRAVAGLSLNGSLCGSLAGPSGFQNRLEVHADVLTTTPQTKRASLSSESANFSLSERSGIMAFNDEPSNSNQNSKTFCGSIFGHREKDSSVSVSMTPLDTQQDFSTRHLANTEPPVYQKMVSNCGSPVSSRSVTFSNEETKLHHSHQGKMKRSKLRSRSFSDKIHEHAGKERENSTMERLSIHSLMTDESGGELSPRDDSSTNHIVDVYESSLPEVDIDIIKTEVAARLSGKSYADDKATSSATSGDDRNHRRKSCELALMEGRLTLENKSTSVVKTDGKPAKPVKPVKPAKPGKPNKKRLVFF